MFSFEEYGPYYAIAFLLFILFVIWVFWGKKSYNLIGLSPLHPETCTGFTGSSYQWDNSISNDNLINNSVDETHNRRDILSTDEKVEISRQDDESVLQESVGRKIERNNISVDSICFSQREESNEGEVSNEIKEKDATIENKFKIDITPILPKYKKLGKFKMEQPRIVNRGNRRGGDSKGEQICKRTMEKIYGLPFEKIRPSWLTNPETGRTLELDCYNEELKIAVEYNGMQHYVWPNGFSQSQQEFINQVRRDIFKREMCDKLGIYLITVPYTVNHDDIPDYIVFHLPENIRKRLEEEMDYGL